MNASAVEWRAELADLAQENRKLREQIATMPGSDASVIGLQLKKNNDE